MIYGQSMCLSYGDSIIFVHLDSFTKINIPVIFLINKKGQIISVLTNKRNDFNIPLNKGFFSTDKENNYFQYLQDIKTN